MTPLEEATQGEYEYARDLNDRYDLNLTYVFLRHRKGVRQLIKCFGYHKDSDDADSTGHHRISLLRKSYYYSSDPAWLAEKLNGRIDKREDLLSANDLEFMIEIMNGSDRPLQEEDVSAKDSEDDLEEIF